MCIHPRCKETSYYRLTGTGHGTRIDLCKTHGPIYKKDKGGKLLRLLVDSDEQEETIRRTRG